MTPKRCNRLIPVNEKLDWLRQHVTYNSDDCLIYPFSDRKRKPTIFIDSKTRIVQSVMLKLCGKNPADGEENVISTCNNGKRCVNPKHLKFVKRGQNHKNSQRWAYQGYNKVDWIQRNGSIIMPYSKEPDTIS